MFNFRKRIIIILSFILVLTFSVYSFQEYSGNGKLLEAEKQYKEGNFKEALRLLKEFKRENESNKEIMKEEFSLVYYLFSKIYFDLEDFDKMENNLKALFKLNPDYKFSEEEDSGFIQKALEIKKEIEKKERLITIILKNGERKKGKFLYENDETITIETGLGTESIKKKYILETRPPLKTFHTEKKTKIKREVPQRLKRKTKQKSDTSKFSLFFNGGYVGGSKVLNTNYELNWYDEDYYNASDTGNILADISSGFGFSGGFRYLIGSNIGVSLSFNYNLKQNVDLSSDYIFSITWWDEDVWDYEGNWENTGEVTVMPLAFNIVYSASWSDDFFINVYGGLAVFLTKVNLSSHVGFGAIYHDVDVFIPDWFDLEVSIEKSDTIVGGNVGIEFGKKISNRVGVYLGGQYFYAPQKEYEWMLVERSRYDGQLDQLWTPEILESDMAEAITKINFSFFNVFIGININL